jgi:hypothetical protein
MAELTVYVNVIALKFMRIAWVQFHHRHGIARGYMTSALQLAITEFDCLLT